MRINFLKHWTFWDLKMQLIHSDQCQTLAFIIFTKIRNIQLAVRATWPPWCGVKVQALACYWPYYRFPHSTMFVECWLCKTMWGTKRRIIHESQATKRNPECHIHATRDICDSGPLRKAYRGHMEEERLGSGLANERQREKRFSFPRGKDQTWTGLD